MIKFQIKINGDSRPNNSSLPSAWVSSGTFGGISRSDGFSIGIFHCYVRVHFKIDAALLKSIKKGRNEFLKVVAL